MNLKIVIERLKKIIAPRKKLYNKDIANMLNIPDGRFRVMIHRDQIPYKEIIDFCSDRNISTNFIFTGKGKKILKG